MIPADRVLIDGDTGWLIVDPAVAWGEYGDLNRPCETCGGNGEVSHPVGRDSFGNWDTIEGPCDCIDGRHTFDLSVVTAQEHRLVATYRVAIIEILPIVDDPEAGDAAYHGPARIDWSHGSAPHRFYPAWDGSQDWEDGTDVTLPSAAAPGMFAVKLAVRA